MAGQALHNGTRIPDNLIHNPHAGEMRRCLVDCDVDAIMKLWAHIYPHLPVIKDKQQALITIHLSRTQAQNIPFKLRAYSHRWLLDHGYPSLLPDELKPKADRIYPEVIEGVGIACGSKSPILKPIMPIVRGAMSDAVLECYADKKSPDVPVVKARMFEAKDKAYKKLLGHISDWAILHK
jgi:hypothetical protein